MKKILLCLLLAAFSSAWGQVSVISVTDENRHSSKEDFYHTFEYFIFPSDRPAGVAGKCQATRIARRWFATAAHCIVPACDSGCTIRMDLLEQPVSALAEVTHTPKKPAVFAHPGYSPARLVENDFALIRLDLDRAPLSYYARPAGERRANSALTKREFDFWLDTHREAVAQLRHVQSPSLPALVRFGAGNVTLKGSISVISIFGGKRTIKPDPHAVHYVRELGFAYTPNFGVRKGMSGSGVMTNTGELIGIISANLTVSAPSGGTKKNTKLSEYFMFPVFNSSIAEFMEGVMGSDYYKLDWKDAYPSLVRKSNDKHSGVIEAVGQVNKNGAIKH